MKEKIPLKKACLTIFLSVAIITGSFSLYFGYYRFIRAKYLNDKKYDVVAIVQTTKNKEPLKTVFLAELLNLSLDQPTHLYRFNVKENERKLLQYPVIKEAKIKKIRPGTIYVDYSLREPIAYLVDYTNTALDHESIIFPFKPFFTPKKLPEIYLGLSKFNDLDPILIKKWGQKLEGKRIQLAFSILEYLKNKSEKLSFILKRIDVSKAYATSFGERQIILVIEHQLIKRENDIPHITQLKRTLRLNPYHFEESLENYWILHQMLERQGKNLDPNFKKLIIDLRLKDLGYIQKEETHV
jgi:cell division septal protein FtsQ